MSKNDQVIQAQLEPIQSNPDIIEVHCNQGIIMGRYKDAITEFKEAVAVDTEYVIANYSIGMDNSNKVSYERWFHPLVYALYLRPKLSESIPDTLRLKVSHEISRQCEILVVRTS